MSVRQAFLSLKTSSKARSVILALAAAASLGAFAACSAGQDDTESYYQEVVQAGRDRLPLRLYQK